MLGLGFISLICDCQKLDLNGKPPRNPSHRNSNLIKPSFIFIFNYTVSIFLIFYFEKLIKGDYVLTT